MPWESVQLTKVGRSEQSVEETLHTKRTRTMRGLNLIIAVITTLVFSQLDTSLAIQCFNCTSTENENCITNASGQSTVDCPNGNCFTSTDGKGTVTRGCFASETTCTETNCQTCNGDKCNTNAVCYNCTGDSCNTVAAAMLSACATDSSKCFTTGTSATNMTRGCTADTSLAYKCPADTTDTSCAICDASQCNKVTYQRTEGSCITCTDCAGSQDTSKAAACTLLYNQASSGCYTTTAGARGCLGSLEGGCTDATTCTSCTGDNCNTAGQEFQCLACLTSEVSGCWSGTGTDIPKVACPNGTCFSGIWNGLGVRDCLTAGSELMQYQCENKVQPYGCETCKTSLCNNVKLNGASSLSQMGVVGLFLGLLVVLRSA
ncbi:major surface trophozoite antigen 11 [Drosophila serrata]|uniref:major surface trophozoite antigen 11 n=1 Tax=Drosophila serrata TaxID=7274 RepID=UPI000A1CF856|nr:major surface trophozoite antigen 11 [Drosophila serrata]